ncbi:MAG: Dihydroorotate dehydrogenase (quinone), partial [uncultured Craurococcus sp.]
DAPPRFPRHAPAPPPRCRDGAWPGAEGPVGGPRRPGRGGGGPDPRHRGLRPALRQPARPGGGLRQGCGGGAAADAPRLRLRRGRHRHAAAAARQSAPAPVPAAGGWRGHQPHGLQQWRGGGLSRPASRPAAAAAGGVRRQYRGEQGGRRPGAGLPGPLRSAGRPRRLRHRQRLLAQYAGPPRPAGGGAAGADPRRHRRHRGAAGPGEDRPGPLGERPRPDHRGLHRPWRRRPHRLQHDDRPAGGPALAPSHGGGRAVRRPAARPGDRDAAPLPRDRAGAADAGRRRRHRQRRRCAGEDQGRRQPGAALHRLRLCRPRPGAGDPPRPRRAAAAGGVLERRRGCRHRGL